MQSTGIRYPGSQILREDRTTEHPERANYKIASTNHAISSEPFLLP